MSKKMLLKGENDPTIFPDLFYKRGHRQDAGVYPSCIWAKTGVHARLNIDALVPKKHPLFNITDIVKKAHIK